MPATVATPPTCYRSLSGPSGPKCPEGVPENGGVRGNVRSGVSRDRAPECPKSVPRVSPECQKGVRDTLGTLSGLGTLFEHSAARGPKGPGDTPSDTPSDSPVFGDTFGDTLGTLRARRARETPVAGRGVCNSMGGCLHRCLLLCFSLARSIPVTERAWVRKLRFCKKSSLQVFVVSYMKFSYFLNGL